MTKLIIPIYLVLCGCRHSETKQQEQVQQSNVVVEKDENFEEFFKKFNTVGKRTQEKNRTTQLKNMLTLANQPMLPTH
jgi:hypothetical protein